MARRARASTWPALIGAVQKPPFDKVGAFDLETFYPGEGAARARDGDQQSARLARLRRVDAGRAARRAAAAVHARGQAAHLDHLDRASQRRRAHVHRDAGAQRSRSRGCARQSGTSSLRAILYMDEIFGYFPPTANPPSKPPMLTLLKQARAFGLGCVLATQNPGGSRLQGARRTAGTWFIGRLQTERDKLRVHRRARKRARRRRRYDRAAARNDDVRASRSACSSCATCTTMRRC